MSQTRSEINFLQQPDPCKIRAVIRSVYRHLFRLKHTDWVLVVTDEPMEPLASFFLKEARIITDQSSLYLIPICPPPYRNLPPSFGALLSDHTVGLLITSYSLSHTPARRQATKKGTRIASMPGIKAETLIRCLKGDFGPMVTMSKKIVDIFTIGRMARLTTPAGTDLTFSILRMRGHADIGLLHEPGQFSNLPAGEGAVSPVPGTAEGRIVVDGSFPTLGRIDEPFELWVKNGYVSRIKGNVTAEKVRKLLHPFGKEGKNIAEVGIGTNPLARLTGLTVEDEKVLGTAHVALGNNVSFDGKVNVPCHFDAVLLRPTLVIDRSTIVKDGVILV